jgi:hypothetical protein
LSFASLDTALAHEASVSYKFDDKNAVSLLARYRRDDYLGTDVEHDVPHRHRFCA